MAGLLSLAGVLGFGLSVQLSRGIVQTVGRLVTAAQGLAGGDLAQRVSVRSKDELGALGVAFNDSVQIVQDLISETGRLVVAAHAGELATRGDAERCHGGYRELVQGINGTLDVVQAPIFEASAVLQLVAGGDLTARVRGDYRGDFATIKNALNTATASLDEGLTRVAAGSEQVATAAAQISDGSQALVQASGVGRGHGPGARVERRAGRGGGAAARYGRWLRGKGQGVAVASAVGASRPHPLGVLALRSDEHRRTHPYVPLRSLVPRHVARRRCRHAGGGCVAPGGEPLPWP